MKSIDKNAGPFDYRPHQSPDTEALLKEPYFSHRDNLIEEAVKEFDEIFKNGTVMDLESSDYDPMNVSWHLSKKQREALKIFLRQTLSDLYAKAEAAGREDLPEWLSKDAFSSRKESYTMAVEEGRAEFAKALLQKTDILLANYSDDRRVPPAEIRKLLESEIKVL